MLDASVMCQLQIVNSAEIVAERTGHFRIATLAANGDLHGPQSTSDLVMSITLDLLLQALRSQSAASGTEISSGPCTLVKLAQNGTT